MLYLKAGQRHYLYDKETKTIDVFDMFGNFLHRGLDQYDPKVIIVKRFVPVVLKARLRTAGISHEECLIPGVIIIWVTAWLCCIIGII